jgi:hypothetical protein
MQNDFVRQGAQLKAPEARQRADRSPTILRRQKPSRSGVLGPIHRWS